MKKFFYMKKYLHEKLHLIWLFGIFLESSKSNGKIEFFSVLYFQILFFCLNWVKLLDCSILKFLDFLSFLKFMFFNFLFFEVFEF
jgi:hypothetical protein